MIAGFQTTDPSVGIACALVYWAYKCRHKNSQANGVKTWERVTSIIKNAAIPSENLNQLLEELCNQFWVENLRPKTWRIIVDIEQAVLRVKRNPDGTLGDIQEIETDAALSFLSWNELVNHYAPSGLTENDIIMACVEMPHIIAALVRLRRDEDVALGRKDRDEETIDVEAVNV